MDNSLKWPRCNKVSGHKKTMHYESKVRYLLRTWLYFYFPKAVANIPIQTLTFSSWLLFRKMIISHLELGLPVAEADTSWSNLINNVSNRVANENSPQCIVDFETTGKCLVTRSGELSCEHSSLLVLRHKPLSNASRREVCKGSGTNNVVSTLSRYSLRSFKDFFRSSISLFHKWLTRQNTKCFHMLWK